MINFYRKFMNFASHIAAMLLVLLFILIVAVACVSLGWWIVQIIKDMNDAMQ